MRGRDGRRLMHRSAQTVSPAQRTSRTFEGRGARERHTQRGKTQSFLRCGRGVHLSSGCAASRPATRPRLRLLMLGRSHARVVAIRPQHAWSALNPPAAMLCCACRALSYHRLRYGAHTRTLLEPAMEFPLPLIRLVKRSMTQKSMWMDTMSGVPEAELRSIMHTNCHSETLSYSTGSATCAIAR